MAGLAGKIAISVQLKLELVLSLESTIPEGRTACLTAGRLDGEAGNRTSYSPVGAGTGAELGNKIL